MAVAGRLWTDLGLGEWRPAARCGLRCPLSWRRFQALTELSERSHEILEGLDGFGLGQSTNPGSRVELDGDADREDVENVLASEGSGGHGALPFEKVVESLRARPLGVGLREFVGAP